MEYGEVVGVLFLLAVLGVFGYYVYRENCCPECGGFRTIQRVEEKYEPVDNKTDAKDIILHVVSEGEYRTKSSIIEWVDRCKECGYESKGERYFRHY